MTDKLQIYVATSWRNPFHAELVRMLRDAGHGVYDFKADAAAFDWREVLPSDATAPAPYSQPTPPKPLLTAAAFRALLDHPKARAGFDADMNALKRADVVVAVQPFGRSAALELGWAAGAGKHTAVLLADHQEPELMLLAADHLFTTYAPCAAWLKGLAVPAPVEGFGTSPETYAATKAFLTNALKDAPSREIAIEIQSLIRAIPTRVVAVKPEHVRQWLRDHAHRDKYHGAIGGHISKSSAGTSLGTMETWKCATCGEHAWVDYEF